MFTEGIQHEMLKPFILGLAPSVSDSAFLDSATALSRAGGNTGNLAFSYAICEHLGGSPLLFAPDHMKEAGTLGVIPCANHLGPHANFAKRAQELGKCNVPLIGIGLGAQSGTKLKVPAVPQGTLDWVRAVRNHAPGDAPNISVRGNFTLHVLDHYGLAGAAVALGCPSLFINPSPRLGAIIGDNIKPPKVIAVGAGHQRWGVRKKLAMIEASLVRLVQGGAGAYIAQSPLEMVTLARGDGGKLDEESLSICRDYICPGMSIVELTEWARYNGAVFFNVPGWLEHCRRFDFVVGTRFHGIMLALQAGVPALCIVHDSRTLELCQTMRVPYAHWDEVELPLTPTSLMRVFAFDPGEFDRNRRKLCAKYVGFLAANRVKPASWLLDIADGGD